MENPNVVNAYAKFKNRNFTVLGVSLDQQGEKDAWMKAVMKDNLTWTQVSDLQFWNSPVVSLYNIQGIPFNVLVDPNGKIIAESTCIDNPIIGLGQLFLVINYVEHRFCDVTHPVCI